MVLSCPFVKIETLLKIELLLAREASQPIRQLYDLPFHRVYSFALELDKFLEELLRIRSRGR